MRQKPPTAKERRSDALDDFLRACSDHGIELVADRMVRATDLCPIADCCAETVRRAIRAGRLKAIKRAGPRGRPGGAPYLVKIEEAARWCFLGPA
jgi:hypothetical protein